MLTSLFRPAFFTVFLFVCLTGKGFEYNGLEFYGGYDSDEVGVHKKDGSNPTHIEIPSVAIYEYYDTTTKRFEKKEYRVTSILPWGFQGCSLTSVSIPNSIKTIGRGAFSACSNLTSISIPNSVTFIGDCAFNDCTNLKSVSLSNSLDSIASQTFTDCSRLTSIVIPNSVISIGRYAFWGCSSLPSITIPNSVMSIGEWAFGECDSLSSIILSNSLEGIETGTFYDCSSLKSVSIPNSVKYIEKRSFADCASLTSIIIPNSVTSIGVGAFRSCVSLTSVTISNSVTSVEDETFWGCDSLSSVTIPNSVTSIGTKAFEFCFNLASLSIPNSVTSIGEYAFQHCDSLTMITIPNSITSIREGNFCNCNNLNTIYIPNSVTLIEKDAFYDKNLKKIFCQSITPPDVDVDAFSYTKTIRHNPDTIIYNYKGTLYVPNKAIEQYKSHNVWKYFTIKPLMSLSPKEGFGTQEYWNEGVDVKGVTADGMSKIDVTQFEKDSSAIPDFQTIKIKFELDGKECTDEKIIGTYGKVEWKDVDVWGFTYTAPEDFPEKIKDNYYILDLTLEAEENGLVAVVGAAQIMVYRPGVMLVHGFGSNANCFASMKNYLTSIGGYEKFQILNVNYSASNKATFKNNTTKNGVIGSNIFKLYQQMADNGIVSSCYDIVGHSMGGILARKYAQEVDHRSVNRIITINTPHSGSEWATTYNILATQVARLMKVLDISYIKNAIKMIAEYNKRWGNWGAIQDLAPDSKAIALLNNSDMLGNARDIPVHALCSTLDMSNATSQSTKVKADSTGFFSIPAIEYFFGKKTDEVPTDLTILKMLFDQELHDGVVQLSSQRGGLGGAAWSLFSEPYKGLFGSLSLAHHCSVTQLSSTAFEISELLHERKSSEFYAKGFNPVDLSTKNARARSSEDVDFKAPTESQFIKIQVEREDKERVLNVKVSGSDDLWLNMVLIGLDEETLLTGIGQSEYRFLIPDTFWGELTVYALGRTNDDALVADSAVISYDRAVSLNYMFFEDWPSVTMMEGQQMELNVVGGWTNGEQNYIIPVYVTDKDGILEINGSQIIAKNKGECLLIATYDGLADTLRVKVMSSVGTGVETLKVNKPSIFYSNDYLNVVSDEPYSGVMIVDLYNLSGALIRQFRRYVSIQAGESMSFDISSLPTGLYITRVKMKEETSKKIYRK